MTPHNKERLIEVAVTLFIIGLIALVFVSPHAWFDLRN